MNRNRRDETTVVTYRTRNGGEAQTTVDAYELAALRRLGRVVEVHEVDQAAVRAIETGGQG